MVNNNVLISHRVNKPGSHIHYKEQVMSEEDIIERRASIRQILKSTSYNNLSNDQVDLCRLEIMNTGFMYEDIDGYETIITSSKVRPEEANFRRVRAMIPFKYMDKRGNDFNWSVYNCDVNSQKEIVNAFITKFEKFRSESKGLYIYSKVKGSGKTMLACCILNELSYKYAISTKFITVLDFIEMTKKGFNGTTEDVDGIYKASVLIIDDIGVQMSKDWVNTVLYRLVNDRYNNKRVTIYTSNIPANDLKIDDRIIERIEADTFTVEIPEVPVRRIKADAEKKALLNNILIKEPSSNGR